MHPIIYTFPESIPLIGGASIYSYGVMMGLGLICAWYLGLHHANREGIPYKTTVTAYALVIVFALIGARVAHLIANPATWMNKNFFEAMFGSKCEGLVAYGGFIGGPLAMWFYVKYMKRGDFWSLADCTTAPACLGLGFTRIGCFLAGCCHGQPTDVSWGVVFPEGSQAASTFGYGTHVHPTQLYESLVGWALLPLALFLLKRRKFTGQVFLILIACYAVARFFLEFIRGDTDRGGFGNHADPSLSTSQFIGLVLIVFVVGFYFYRRKHALAPPEPLSWEEVHQRLLEAGVIKEKSEKKPKTQEAKKNASPKPASNKKQKRGKKNKKRH
jgi:phosphatidylglycerol:prolipoprotein diacylglycerol transferase